MYTSATLSNIRYTLLSHSDVCRYNSVIDGSGNVYLERSLFVFVIVLVMIMFHYIVRISVHMR